MLRDQSGLTQMEYIILAAIVLAVVGLSAWQLARAIAARLEGYRDLL